MGPLFPELSGVLCSIFAIVAAVVVAPFVVVPLFVKFAIQMNTEPEVETFDYVTEKLPGGVHRFFRKMAPRLEALGFESLDPHSTANFTPGSEVFAVPFVHRKRRETVMAIGIVAGEQVHTTVQFATRFADGQAIVTGDSSELSPFPTVFPKYVIRNYPEVTRVEDLYHLHRTIVKDTAPDSPPHMRIETEFGGDVAAYLENITLEEVKRYVQRGFLKTSDGVVYRPTWIGAFKMGWSQLPPIKQILRARRAKANAHWLDLADL